MEDKTKDIEVSEVKTVDPVKRMADGQQVDLYINTGKIGKTFLVKVKGSGNRPTLIAVHL